MKKYGLILTILMVLGLAAQAQTYVGTMKVDGETFRDVSVKLTISGDTAGVLIYRTLPDRVKPVRIDLLIPDIHVDATAQRMSLVCYNIVPLFGTDPYPEYLVKTLHGTATQGVFSFSCKMNEKQVSYSGVINKRAR